MMPPKKQIRVRYPLVEKIEEIADEEGQSITNMTDDLIQRGIRDRKAELADDLVEPEEDEEEDEEEAEEKIGDEPEDDDEEDEEESAEKEPDGE